VGVNRTPDFIQRYPQLGPAALPVHEPRGWEVLVSGFGIPFSWRPLPTAELEGLRPGDVRIAETNDAILRECRCKQLVTRSRAGGPQPGRDLQTLLQLLFGLR
jgi:hypothetical protein